MSVCDRHCCTAGEEGRLKEVELRMQKVFVFFGWAQWVVGFMGEEDRQRVNRERRERHLKVKEAKRRVVALRKRDDIKCWGFYLDVSCSVTYAVVCQREASLNMSSFFSVNFTQDT